MVYFTADTHFGHANIIRLCGRPFADIAQMDEELIRRWNAIVLPEDDIWHLGDFVVRGKSSPSQYLARLKGRKHLVFGNHDVAEARTAPGWSSSSPLAEIIVDRVRLVLCHYALRTWNHASHGALQLYGHSHGNLSGSHNSADVGVDCWDFRPASLDQIRARMATT